MLNSVCCLALGIGPAAAAAWCIHTGLEPIHVRERLLACVIVCRPYVPPMLPIPFPWSYSPLPFLVLSFILFSTTPYPLTNPLSPLPLLVFHSLFDIARPHHPTDTMYNANNNSHELYCMENKLHTRQLPTVFSTVPLLGTQRPGLCWSAFFSGPLIPWPMACCGQHCAG